MDRRVEALIKVRGVPIAARPLNPHVDILSRATQRTLKAFPITVFPAVRHGCINRKRAGPCAPQYPPSGKGMPASLGARRAVSRLASESDSSHRYLCCTHGRDDLDCTRSVMNVYEITNLLQRLAALSAGEKILLFVLPAMVFISVCTLIYVGIRTVLESRQQRRMNRSP